MTFPNWTVLPTDAGFSWRVWEGDAEERGHATTKEAAMREVQESCRRVGHLDSVPEFFTYPYWNTDKLREAVNRIDDALHASDDRALEKCLDHAKTLINQVIEEENA